MLSILVFPSLAKELQIHMIDVWQGDCILVVTPNNKKLLIDSGDLRAGDKVLSYLKKQGIQYIDVALLTHPHADHLGGFIKVLEKIKVGKVYDSTDYYTQTYKTFRRILQEKNITRLSALKGDVINLDSEVKIDVLSPVKTKTITPELFKKEMTYTQKRSMINNRSIVLKISYGKDTFFTSGDAEFEAEEIILKNYNNIGANLFKAGHHGSKTSSSQQILNKIDPEIILISVGKGNKFGHPHASTIKKFEKTQAEVFRTDHYGDVVLSSQGAGWTREPIKEIFNFITSKTEFLNAQSINLQENIFEINSKIHFRVDKMIDLIIQNELTDFNSLLLYLETDSNIKNKSITLFVKILLEKLRLLTLSGEKNALVPLKQLNDKIKKMDNGLF